MARITDLTALTSPALNDVAVIVDVSDGTQSANGTTKQVTVGNLPFVQSTGGGEEGLVTNASASGAVTLNLASGNVFALTLTGAVTLTFSGATSGVACSFTLYLTENSTGGYGVTWPGSVSWLGGVAPVLNTAANAVNLLVFETVTGGSTWYGSQVTGAPSLPLTVLNGGTGLSAGGVAGTLLTGQGTSSPGAWQGLFSQASVQTANCTVAAGTLVPCDTSAGSFTATLASAPFAGAMAGVKQVNMSGSYYVTLACGGTDVFNKNYAATASTSFTLPLQSQGALVQYAGAGTAWSFTGTSSTANLTISSGPAFAVGNVVYLAGGSLPAGLSANTRYYVVASASTTFQLSATYGGSAITPSGSGSGSAQTCGVWMVIGDDLPLGQLDQRYAALLNTTDWINVTKSPYLADSSGVNDATTQINAALAAAASGQVVYLPEGTYKTSAPLTIPQGVILLGASGGWAEPSGNYGIGGTPVSGAVIAPSSAFTPTSGNGAAVIYLTAGNVQSGQQQIRQISIDGQNAPSSNSIHGIQAYNAIAGVKLRDVLVYGGTSSNLGGNGLDMRPGANQNPDFWDVAHCKFSSMGGNGVSINGAADNYFFSCEATGNTGANWNVTNCGNTRFVGCKGENSGSGQGWYLTAASGFTGELAFTGCTSQFNHLDGWYLTGPGAGVYQFTGCRSAGDAESSGAAFTVAGSFAGTVQLTGWASVPVSSVAATGLKISSVSSSAWIMAANSVLWGYSTSVSNDGSAAAFLQSQVVYRTGSASSPTSTLAPGTGTNSLDWVNAAQAPYSASNGGSVNVTTAIQNAINAAAGGVCYLPAGTYKVGNLTLPASTTLVGDGAGATVLSVASGTTGAVIALTTPSTTRRVCVRDLMIEGNNVSVTGVSLDNTSLSPSTPGQHRLYNVIVQDCGVDAFYYGTALVETMTIGCTAYNAGRYGFNITTGATDSRWVSCTTGPSVGHGWVVTGSNNHFSACKAYYAGYSSGTFTSAGHGWYVLGVSSYPTMGVTWDGCEAQDCGGQGWNFNPSTPGMYSLAMNACVIDSCNAYAQTGTAGAAIATAYVTYSSVTNCVAWNRSGGAGTMTYGISVTGPQTGLVISGNAFQCSTGAFGYISGYGYLLTESYIYDLTGVSSYVKVPSLVQAPASAQALSNSTAITVNTAYALIPLTASAAVTGITMPTSGLQSGQTVTLLNQSAYSITFAASGTSNVADGTSDVIPVSTAVTYVWNGNTSLWYRHAGLMPGNNLADVASAASAYNTLSPMTTLGDVEYESAANTASRLAGNTTTTKKFFTQTGTGSISAAPGWNTIAASDLTLFVGDWEPSDYGLLAWTYDPAFVTTQHAATSETLFLVRVNVRQQVSCTYVVLGMQVNGSSLTTGQNFSGLYAGQANGGTWSAGSLVATTSDQTTNWGSSANEGMFAMALSGGPYTLPAGFYWVAIQAVGSGVPSFYEIANSVAPPAGGLINAGSLGVSTARSCTNGTTHTSTLPGSITPSSNVLNVSQWWAAIS